MGFSARRGRPKTGLPEKDFGTPELQKKRLLNATSEPIDLCLFHQIIDDKQHWCGMHLRWLYTIRYGAPSITSRYTTTQWAPQYEDSSAWRTNREQEYHEAVHLLRKMRHYEPVMRLCVFNELPRFLGEKHQQAALNDQYRLNAHIIAREQLCEGLNLLVIHWLKGKNTK